MVVILTPFVLMVVGIPGILCIQFNHEILQTILTITIHHKKTPYNPLRKILAYLRGRPRNLVNG